MPTIPINTNTDAIARALGQYLTSGEVLHLLEKAGEIDPRLAPEALLRSYLENLDLDLDLPSEAVSTIATYLGDWADPSEVLTILDRAADLDGDLSLASLVKAHLGNLSPEEQDAFREEAEIPGIQHDTLRPLLREAAREGYAKGAEDCSGWDDVKDLADAQVDRLLAYTFPAWFDKPEPETRRGGPPFEWGKRYILTRPGSPFPPGEVYLKPGRGRGCAALAWVPDPTQTVTGGLGHPVARLPDAILQTWPDAYWEEA